MSFPVADMAPEKGAIKPILTGPFACAHDGDGR